MSVRERRLEEALADHHAAVVQFAARAADCDPARWTTPRSPEAWSPAEITEHLVLVFDAVGAELDGGAGIRLRFGPIRRFLFRRLALPRILRGRGFPTDVKSVREARPQGTQHEREESLSRLHRAAARFEEAARSAPRGTRISHPFFGRLPLPKAVRFSAAHIRHHAAQLPSAPRG